MESEHEEEHIELVSEYHVDRRQEEKQYAVRQK